MTNDYSTLLNKPMADVVYDVVMRYDTDYLTAENLATDVLNFSDLLRGTAWWKSFESNEDRHTALIKMAWEIEYIWIDPAYDDGYFETYEGFLAMKDININDTQEKEKEE